MTRDQEHQVIKALGRLEGKMTCIESVVTDLRERMGSVEKGLYARSGTTGGVAGAMVTVGIEMLRRTLLPGV